MNPSKCKFCIFYEIKQKVQLYNLIIKKYIPQNYLLLSIIDKIIN